MSKLSEKYDLFAIPLLAGMLDGFEFRDMSDIEALLELSEEEVEHDTD